MNKSLFGFFLFSFCVVTVFSYLSPIIVESPLPEIKIKTQRPLLIKPSLPHFSTLDPHEIQVAFKKSQHSSESADSPEMPEALKSDFSMSNEAYQAADEKSLNENLEQIAEKTAKEMDSIRDQSSLNQFIESMRQCSLNKLNTQFIKLYCLTSLRQMAQKHNSNESFDSILKEIDPVILRKFKNWTAYLAE